MATYTLPNTVAGGSIQVSGNSLADAQQAAANATGVTLAQQQAGGTFGSNSLVTSTTPAMPNTPGGISDADMAKLRSFFGETSGFSIKELEEKKREFDATLTENQRQFNDRQTEEIRQFNATLGLNQGRLGLDLLTTASQMGGPENVFQAADFYRGAQQRSDVPIFLQSLLSNTGLPSFTGAGGQAPTPLTAAGVAARLTGASPDTTGMDADRALAAIGDVFKSGVSGLAPGALEQLNPAELGVLQSGAKRLGYSWGDLVNTYTKSRIGQRATVPV